MSFLRITAGQLRGRRIAIPRGDVRPTSERARQAYFNIIGDRISGARYLDLFAGSGIFSFEAVSRGAASAIAIDRDTSRIASQAEELGANVKTIAGEVLMALERLPDEPVDLVYADPPYDYDRYDDLLQAIGKIRLAPNAVVAVEHRRRSNPFNPEPKSGGRGRLQILRRAEYGEVWITFFTAG